MHCNKTYNKYCAKIVTFYKNNKDYMHIDTYFLDSLWFFLRNAMRAKRDSLQYKYIHGLLLIYFMYS